MAKITDDVLAALFDSAKAGDKDAHTVLQDYALLLARRAIVILGRRGALRHFLPDDEDLAQVANLAALEALASADPSKAKLRTWIYRKVMFAILSHARDLASHGVTGRNKEVVVGNGPITDGGAFTGDYEPEEELEQGMDAYTYTDAPEGFEDTEIQITREQMHATILRMGDDGMLLALYFGLHRQKPMTLVQLAQRYGVSVAGMQFRMQQAMMLFKYNHKFP